MIIKMMSLTARKELLARIRQKYPDPSQMDKGKILNGFVGATNYGRKHAIQLLNEPAKIVSRNSSMI